MKTETTLVDLKETLEYQQLRCQERAREALGDKQMKFFTKKEPDKIFRQIILAIQQLQEKNSIANTNL